MNNAIQIQHSIARNLTITARKRTIKQILIKVLSGIALFRLGKADYVIRPQQSLWIPFDCLSSLTIMPNTELIQVELSMRLTQSFPPQAGYVTLSPLTEEILQKLLQTTRHENIYAPLLQVLREELTALTPELTADPLSEQISAWQPDNRDLDRELHYALLAREAKKWQQSGKKESVVIEQLFAGNEAHYQQIMQLFFGHDLSHN